MESCADAKLRAGEEDRFRFLGKNHRLNFWQEQPEQRRPEQDTRNHLANDLGLAEEPLAEFAHDPTGEQDDGELQEEMDAVIAGGKACRGGRRGGAVRRQDTSHDHHDAVPQIVQFQPPSATFPAEISIALSSVQ